VGFSRGSPRVHVPTSFYGGSDGTAVRHRRICSPRDHPDSSNPEARAGREHWRCRTHHHQSGAPARDTVFHRGVARRGRTVSCQGTRRYESPLLRFFGNFTRRSWAVGAILFGAGLAVAPVWPAAVCKLATSTRGRRNCAPTRATTVTPPTWRVSMRHRAMCLW